MIWLMGVQARELKDFIHTNMLFDLTWWPWLVWVTADLVGLGGSWWSTGFTPTKYFQPLRGGWKIPAKTRALKSSRHYLSASPMTLSTSSALHQVYKQLTFTCDGINNKCCCFFLITIVSYVAAKLNHQSLETHILLSNGHRHSWIIMFSTIEMWESGNFCTFLSWQSKK